MKKILEYPRLFFAFAVTVQTALLIDSRALWFSDEIRYANAFSNLTNAGKWLVLYLNGEPYPDKPPVYFWMVYIVQKVTTLDIPPAMFLTSAICGFIYLLAHYWFAVTVTGEKRLSLISGMILLTNFYFIGLMNYVRMDLLFASLIIFSFTFMYKYLTEDRSRYVYYAFLLASIAVLTKGPIGVLMPLIFFLAGVFLFRRYRKLFSFHLLFAFLVTLVPIAGWMFAIIVIEGRDFLEYLINTQVVKRAVNTWHHKQPFYYYTYALTLAWLPWVLIVLTSAKEIKNLSISFFKEGRGAKYASAAFISGFLLLSALSGKIAIYALPIFSPLAVYLAYVYVKTEQRTLFWRVVSIFFALAGILLIFVNQLPDIPGRVEGNYPTAVFAFVCAAVTWIFSKDDLLKSAFVFVIAVSVFFNVAGLFLVPSLDIVMSPKKQAAIMKKYIAKGYKPAAYKVYSGLYTFYAGDDVSESKRLDEITKLVSSGEKVVLGIAEKHWKRWKGRPAGLRIVDEQWIAGRNYFLVINR